MIKLIIAFVLACSLAPVAIAGQSYEGGASHTSDTIDRALGQIIPVPYKILLDASVPTSLKLVWTPGDDDNWMQVLQKAIAPMGLMAKPDWAANTITVTWAKQAPPSRQTERVEMAPRKAATISEPMPAPSQPSVSGMFVVESDEEIEKPQKATQDAPVERVGKGVARRPLQVILAKNAAPSRVELDSILNATSAGGKIVVTGYSGSSDERSRVKWSNTYAQTLVDKLVKAGVPKSSIVFVPRETYRDTGDKVRVEISDYKEELY